MDPDGPPATSPLLPSANRPHASWLAEAGQSGRRALRVLRSLAPGGGPVYAHVGVTHRCDLTCSMCAIWMDGDRSRELPPAGHERIARALRRAGVIVVSLGGGEPFAREDLAGVVAAYAGQGLDVRVLTNGQKATDERIAELVSAGLRGASVSLDSLDADLFDALCERQGTWTRAVAAMDRLRRWLPPPLGPLVMNTVVSARNLSELPALARFAAARGFVASFLPVELPRPGDPHNKFIRDAEGMGCGTAVSADVHRVYDELVEMKRRGEAVFSSTWYLQASRLYLTEGRAPPRCDAGDLYLSVGPDGALATCHLGPSLGPAGAGDLVARLREDRARNGAPRDSAWCGPGCARACWHEVTATFRDPLSLAETVRDRTRMRVSRALTLDPG